MTTEELVRVVKLHAQRNYADPHTSWDVVVECWSDADVAEAIGRATTRRGAIWKVGQRVAPYHDRRREVLAEAGEVVTFGD